MEPGTLHAVYRKKDTLIFGGHFIEKGKLGKWVKKMIEHLQIIHGSNKDPGDIVLYLEKALELLTNAHERGRLEDWGERERRSTGLRRRRKISWRLAVYR